MNALGAFVVRHEPTGGFLALSRNRNLAPFTLTRHVEDAAWFTEWDEAESVRVDVDSSESYKVVSLPEAVDDANC